MALENTGFITMPDLKTKSLRRVWYSLKSLIGRVATPDSMAALATASGTVVISLGSNGFGIRYSRPKPKSVSP